MKCRRGHVTNSSSSSFIVSKRKLDNDQIKAIQNHIELSKQLGETITNLDFPWDIEEDENFITGYVFMDNFDMYNFLHRIGVNLDSVTWGSNRFYLEENKEENKEIELSYDKEKWRELVHEM